MNMMMIIYDNDDGGDCYRNDHFLMITFHSETKLIEAEKNTWQWVVLLLLVVIGGEHLNDNIMVE